MQKAVSPISASTPHAILFDFDGTLVDSAPDLAGAANDLRVELGLELLPYTVLRPYATYGARSLLKQALDLSPGDVEYEQNRQRFLAIYDERKLEKSHLFPGVMELLIALERQKIAWGIVTNKHSRFAAPMIHELLRDRAFVPATVVCGDTTATPKPHPAPILHAASAMRIDPKHCWFIGDGESDIKASIAAGMTPVLAAYGYVPDLEHARGWGAAHEIDHPLALLGLLETAGSVA